MASVIFCSNFGAPQNKVSHHFHCFRIYLPWSDGTECSGSFKSQLCRVALTSAVVLGVWGAFPSYISCYWARGDLHSLGFNVFWDKYWVGRKRERAQRKHRAQGMMREDPWEDGGFRGSHFQGRPSNPLHSGCRASGKVRSLPRANSHQDRSTDHLWDKLFFLLTVLMWLSYFGQPFK